jgi:hypothetical protein
MNQETEPKKPYLHIQRTIRTMKIEFNDDVMTITTDVVPKGDDRREVFRSRLYGVIAKLEGEISRLMTDKQVADEITEIKRRREVALANPLTYTITPTDQ